MTEMITDLQLKKMAKVFRRSGRTFQALAAETCMTSVPDHVTELTKDEAKELLRCFSSYLVKPCNKQ